MSSFLCTFNSSVPKTFNNQFCQTFEITTFLSIYSCHTCDWNYDRIVLRKEGRSGYHLKDISSCFIHLRLCCVNWKPRLCYCIKNNVFEFVVVQRGTAEVLLRGHTPASGKVLKLLYSYVFIVVVSGKRWGKRTVLNSEHLSDQNWSLFQDATFTSEWNVPNGFLRSTDSV
jgi:hypothetical protein